MRSSVTNLLRLSVSAFLATSACDVTKPNGNDSDDSALGGEAGSMSDGVGGGTVIHHATGGTGTEVGSGGDAAMAGDGGAGAGGRPMGANGGSEATGGSEGEAPAPDWAVKVAAPILAAATGGEFAFASESNVKAAWADRGEVDALESFWADLEDQGEVTPSDFDFDLSRGGTFQTDSGSVGLFIVPNSIAEQESQIVRATLGTKTVTWLEYWAQGEVDPVLTLVFATSKGLERLTIEEFVAISESLPGSKASLLRREPTVCNDKVDGLCEDLSVVVGSDSAFMCAMRSLPVLLRITAPLCAPLVTALGIGAPACAGVVAGVAGAGLCVWANTLTSESTKVACQQAVGCGLNKVLGLDSCSCLEFESDDCGIACSDIAGNVCHLVDTFAKKKTSRNYKTPVTSIFCRAISEGGSRGSLNRPGKDCKEFLSTMCEGVIDKTVGDRLSSICKCECDSTTLSERISCISCGDGACREGETPANCPEDCGDGDACGDFNCRGSETKENCPADCGPPGGAWGEPHMYTFDGLHYDFQRVGEFVLAQTDAALNVQVRLAPYANSTQVSTIVAVAAEIGSDRVEVNALGTMGTELWVNGTVVTSSSTLPGGGAAGLSGFTWPDGTRLDIVDHGGRLDVQLRGLSQGGLRGLLGNANGDLKDEFRLRDGTALTHPLDEAGWAAFTQAWRISGEESLFHYDVGQDTSTFTDLLFPDAVASTSALSPSAYAAAKAICLAAGVSNESLLDDCILDVGVTGDAGFATGAATLPLPLSADPAIYSLEKDAQSLNVDLVSSSGTTPLASDGTTDGVFSVVLRGPVTALVLSTATSSGAPSGGSYWDTVIGAIPANVPRGGDTTWVIGAQDAGTASFINNADGSLPALDEGLHHLTLYVDTDGSLRSGAYLRLYGVVPNGSVVASPVLAY